MFIRHLTVNGGIYYQVVESYRDQRDGRVHTRMLASLGTSPTLQDAFRKCEDRYFAARKGRKSAPFDDCDRKRWCRLAKIERLLRKDKNSDYVRSAAFQAEVVRWRRANNRQENEEASWPDDLFPDNGSFYAVLGLSPDASPDDVVAAYRRKARECHPDHGGSDEAMAAVNGAYERLMQAG